MGEKIVVGPIKKGLSTFYAPFAIDNDSFPVLINAYQHRGKIKRKRGTTLLTRLQRYLGTTDAGGNLVVTILPIPIGIGISSFVIGTDFFVDPGGASPVALLTNSSGTGTLNRATGVLTITGSIALTSVFIYQTLPVMGLKDFHIPTNQFPLTIAFDTKYSYTIINTIPYSSYDVSFYKNPPPTATYPAYVDKTVVTPTWWNGQDYQQFWTVNYQGALWATNGINIPFSVTNIGMQFVLITGILIVAAGPPASATITTNISHGLVIGDFVFINEVVGITGINLQTGYVTAVPAVNQITVTFPEATLGGAWASGGIVQYLTNRIDTTIDGIRWYDGDPTDGSITSPTLTGDKGWVNFAPPLSKAPYIISDLPEAQYYLVGARMIVPFKDRLLFIGPVVQTSSAGSQRYLQDTVIYSLNGTPYYTASFTGDSSHVDTEFLGILIPDNQTAFPNAFVSDQSGFGGFIQAGISEPINTASLNEDVLILGFTTIQTRFVYTGNDIIPFNFFIINSELGSGSTFSAINLDRGVITKGSRGYVITSQEGAQRIDLEIPDDAFQVKLTENGAERICSSRDFINEWIYFTFPSNQVNYKFPTRTLQYNYREETWATFNESYTTYGSYRKQTGFTWQTVGTIFPTWSSWNQPWNAGTSTLEQPNVIAGNQQGFVFVKDDGTNEGNSLAIQNISVNTITSPNHNLNNEDYIIISGAFGTVSSQINKRIFSVQNATTNTFQLNPPITAATYLGGGVIKRMYVPFIQSKQFPTSWDLGRKTRLGPQQYLLATTDNGQITLLIYLSQDADDPYNDGRIVPQSNVQNNGLIYSAILYTAAESTNLGLTPANINLNMVTAAQQEQTWHRVSTSLIGDTVQVGFTLSDAQMRSFDDNGTTKVITAISQATDAAITVANTFSIGDLVLVKDVVGMTELNNNIYEVIAASTASITIDVNSTAFTAYVSGGTVTGVAPNQFAEIEIFGFILDVNPSQMLA